MRGKKLKHSERAKRYLNALKEIYASTLYIEKLPDGTIVLSGKMPMQLTTGKGIDVLFGQPDRPFIMTQGIEEARPKEIFLCLNGKSTIEDGSSISVPGVACSVTVNGKTSLKPDCKISEGKKK